MIRPRAIRELTIEGGRFISAGSGLVRTGDFIYVIADDEREFGVFPAEGDDPGRLARFLPGDLPLDPKERKQMKPDLEALALLPGAVLAHAVTQLRSYAGTTELRTANCELRTA